MHSVSKYTRSYQYQCFAALYCHATSELQTRTLPLCVFLQTFYCWVVRPSDFIVSSTQLLCTFNCKNAQNRVIPASFSFFPQSSSCNLYAKGVSGCPCPFRPFISKPLKFHNYNRLQGLLVDFHGNFCRVLKYFYSCVICYV